MRIIDGGGGAIIFPVFRLTQSNVPVKKNLFFLPQGETAKISCIMGKMTYFINIYRAGQHENRGVDKDIALSH
jgi:hypothetical protein